MSVEREQAAVNVTVEDEKDQQYTSERRFAGLYIG